jgi:hypothetical protein
MAAAPLQVKLSSFGYTQGAPDAVDSSSIYDVRGLPNPKLRRAYKHLTGEDNELQRQILETERGQLTYEHFDRWLDAHITRARLSGLATLQLYVGCKSGQHRSVSVVSRCGDLRADDSTSGNDVSVCISHRDRDHWVTSALMQKCELCLCEIHRNAWSDHVNGKRHMQLAMAGAANTEPQEAMMEVRQKRQKKRRPQKEETAQDARKSMHNQKRSRLVHEETTSADPQKPPPRDDCTLRGALPEGADAAAIEALLERRMEAKRSKDYTTADMLQRDLVAQGVDLNDQERWWRRRSSETRISTSTTSRSSNG